jgi:mono/diheme cytochrome c family protein
MYRMHRWLRAVPLLMIVAALALAVVGCGGDSATTTTASPATDTTASGGGDIDAAALYSANCASCHGAGGEGGVGPDLRGETDIAFIEGQVTNGGGSMPAYGDELSADEISAIATYVVGLE